jgi:hypothetical protein
VDAGDSWFNAAKLHLPGACAFEIQACYASIGWSVGAALGYGLGAPGRRVVQIVGDGAFQMTAQVPACLLLLLLLLWLHAFCDAALARAGRACLYCCWLAAHGRVPFVRFRFIVLK